MEYRSLPFAPGVGSDGSPTRVADALQDIIVAEAANGWEFVGLQNHDTWVPGSNGCFGIGKTEAYPKSFSVAVFKR